MLNKEESEEQFIQLFIELNKLIRQNGEALVKRDSIEWDTLVRLMNEGDFIIENMAVKSLETLDSDEKYLRFTKNDDKQT